MRKVRCEEEKIYGRYLKDVRLYRGVYQEELGKGICSQDLISKVELGKRYPDKLERDRFLDRLGENGYDFECYLEDEEYEEWLKRRKIIALLHKGRLEEAETRLNEFREEKRKRSKLEQQFLLTMQAQLMELQGASKEEMGPVIKEAVEQTVPKGNTIDELWLSVQELNLVLEYITYKNADYLEQQYLELLHYMERDYFDIASKAKMCPKIALYYAKLIKSKRDAYTEEQWEKKVRKAVEVCSFGLDCLRNHEKIYYAVELLQIYEYFLDAVCGMDGITEEERLQFVKEKEQMQEFLVTFQTLYREFHVPEQTPGYLCFYMEYELHSYSDVIRARRKMFGYSKEEMLDVISMRTLERLETTEINSQRGTAQALFKKLGLSTALHRAQIVTDKALVVTTPAYVNGFAFYYDFMDNIVERVCITDVLKENKEIRMLINSLDTTYMYGCGYRMKKQEVDMDTFSLKVLAQDSDFDLYLLKSSDANAYNIKKNGAFYPLNEVEGVQEYLDACFPYLKEVATNEDGDIWMLPIETRIPGIFYDKEYCVSQGVDFSTMDYEEFLVFTEKIELQTPEKINNVHAITEFFAQYLSVESSFDTELFRKNAKQLKSLYEKIGENKFYHIMPTHVNGVLQGELPQFFYEYMAFSRDLPEYTKNVEYLGVVDKVGMIGVPKIREGLVNVGTCAFFAVNPQSENLEATIEYLSTLCTYLMQQQDSFLLSDESMYSDNAFMKECYEVYANGGIYFAMDSEVYSNVFL